MLNKFRLRIWSLYEAARLKLLKYRKSKTIIKDAIDSDDENEQELDINNSVDNNKSSRSNNADTMHAMPEDWYPDGWLIFIQHGALADKSSQIVLNEVGNGPTISPVTNNNNAVTIFDLTPCKTPNTNNSAFIIPKTEIINNNIPNNNTYGAVNTEAQSRNILRGNQKKKPNESYDSTVNNQETEMMSIAKTSNTLKVHEAIKQDMKENPTSYSEQEIQIVNTKRKTFLLASLDIK